MDISLLVSVVLPWLLMMLSCYSRDASLSSLLSGACLGLLISLAMFWLCFFSGYLVFVGRFIGGYDFFVLPLVAWLLDYMAWRLVLSWLEKAERSVGVRLARGCTVALSLVVAVFNPFIYGMLAKDFMFVFVVGTIFCALLLFKAK